MIEKIRNVHALELCTLARDDASTLDFPLPDAIFGFHAQQAAEKSMKALIGAHKRIYPFTHDLKSLVDILQTCGEALPDAPFGLLTLQQYAVELRYHVSEGMPQQDRSSMKEAVLQYNQHVVARILELEARDA